MHGTGTARLSIYLLGSFRVVLDGRPATEFISNKARALLAYLAVESDHPHTRETLAGLLWPDCPKERARNSLRTALDSVRRAIGDRQAEPPFLDIGPQTIQFNLSSDSCTDAVALVRLLPTRRFPRHPDHKEVAQWEQAVDLYGGRFLQDLVAKSDVFEEWALQEQEALQRLVLEALDHLVDWYEGHAQFDRAQQYARRQVDIDPLRESAHRQLMRLLALAGQRAAALAQYEACRRALREDLDAEPDELTAELYRQIRAGEIRALPTPSRPRLPYIPPPAPEIAVLADAGPLPPDSRLPFGRNALFTGRQDSLLTLARALLYAPADAMPVTQAISGMPGMGKTQLAVEFAHRYGRFFRSVCWLNTEQPDLIPAEIAVCGEKMLLAAWPTDQPGQVECTLRAWHDDGPHLVILDDLEDVPAARVWLPQLSHPNLRLVITARRSRWPADLGLACLPLGLFSAVESLAFLRKHLPSEERFSEADLQALADRLGHLPLALQLAGRYLAEMPSLTAHDYVAALTSALSDPAMAHFAADLGDPVGHDLGLASTFYSSWRRVRSEEERRVFLLSGYCAPNQPIPCILLERAAALERASCDRALSVLTGLGLLDLPDPAAGPTVHPLLAEYARLLCQSSQTGDDTSDPLPDLVAALVQLSHEANESDLPGRVKPFRPHLEAVAPVAQAAGLGAGRLWSELGRCLYAIADYHSARTCLERALQLDEASVGVDDAVVAQDLNDLGSVLQDLGDLLGARACYERALHIAEATFGPRDTNVARAVNNLGLVLQALGELAAARACYERALSIDEASYGPHHTKTVRDVNNLGSVLRALGDFPAARACYERALLADEATFGPNHPNVATLVNNLGSVLKDLNDLSAARACYARSLRIDIAAFGPHHPKVAVRVNNLGAAHLALGNARAARACFQFALRIDEAVFGHDHPKVAIRASNLGRALQALGELPAARACYERALRIDEAAFGPDHPKIAIRAHNLGMVLAALGDCSGARAAFERALAIRERCLPPDHPKTRAIRDSLASLPPTSES